VPLQQFSEITTGPCFVVQQQAVLAVHNTLLDSYQGATAWGVMAYDSAAVMINNNTFSNMMTAGVVTTRERVSLSVYGSTFSIISINAWDPTRNSVIELQAQSTARVSWGCCIHDGQYTGEISQPQACNAKFTTVPTCPTAGGMFLKP
jgi:hypothetical protein